MSKKDYERAAEIAQDVKGGWRARKAVIESFIALFKKDERFKEERFMRACVPGANVRART